MAVTLKDKNIQQQKREILRTKKMKSEKISKRMAEVFRKLNNKNCYAFMGDDESWSYYNLLMFLTLLEKKCEKNCGKSKRYSVEDIRDCIGQALGDLTDRQAKTLNAINKTLKKTTDHELLSFRFDKIGKYEGSRVDPDEIGLMPSEEIYERW